MFLGVICSPSHCSLTVALVEVEDTTVATVEYLELRTPPVSQPQGWMCGAPELLGLLGMLFHPCQLPSSFLRQSHRLVICVNTASACPSAQHISDLCFEVFLLQSQGKKVALEQTAMSARPASCPNLGRIQDYLRATSG